MHEKDLPIFCFLLIEDLVVPSTPNNETLFSDNSLNRQILISCIHAFLRDLFIFSIPLPKPSLIASMKIALPPHDERPLRLAVIPRDSLSIVESL